MKFKCAVWQSAGGTYQSVWSSEPFGTYIRMSEFVDIEFAPLTRAETVKSELSVLEKLEADTSTEFATKLKAIKTRRAELLAITYDDPANCDGSTTDSIDTPQPTNV